MEPKYREDYSIWIGSDPKVEQWPKVMRCEPGKLLEKLCRSHQQHSSLTDKPKASSFPAICLPALPQSLFVGHAVEGGSLRVLERAPYGIYGISSPCTVLSGSSFLSASAMEDVDNLDEERCRRARDLVGSEGSMAVGRFAAVEHARPRHPFSVALGCPQLNL